MAKAGRIRYEQRGGGGKNKPRGPNKQSLEKAFPGECEGERGKSDGGGVPFRGRDGTLKADPRGFDGLS